MWMCRITTVFQRAQGSNSKSRTAPWSLHCQYPRMERGKGHLEAVIRWQLDSRLGGTLRSRSWDHPDSIPTVIKSQSFPSYKGLESAPCSVTECSGRQGHPLTPPYDKCERNQWSGQDQPLPSKSSTVDLVALLCTESSSKEHRTEGDRGIFILFCFFFPASFVFLLGLDFFV